MGTKVLIAPSRYVQGPGVLAELGAQVKQLGGKVFVTGGKTALSQTRESIEASLKNEGLEGSFEVFRGECCDSEINRLMEAAKGAGCNVVVSVGGAR